MKLYQQLPLLQVYPQQMDLVKLFQQFSILQNQLAMCIQLKTNDGIIHERKTAFCNICNKQISQSTEHCLICNKCVEQFDHHCLFLNKCIGKYNIKLFYSYLITTAISSIATIIVQIINIIIGTLYMGYRGVNRIIVIVFAPILILICIFSGIESIYLIFYHKGLRKRNLGTYQLMIMADKLYSRQQYTNYERYLDKRFPCITFQQSSKYFGCFFRGEKKLLHRQFSKVIKPQRVLSIIPKQNQNHQQETVVLNKDGDNIFSPTTTQKYRFDMSISLQISLNMEEYLTKYYKSLLCGNFKNIEVSDQFKSQIGYIKNDNQEKFDNLKQFSEYMIKNLGASVFISIDYVNQEKQKNIQLIQLQNSYKKDNSIVKSIESILMNSNKQIENHIICLSKQNQIYFQKQQEQIQPNKEDEIIIEIEDQDNQ